MVGLVDCNNFFVSCERIFEPALEGRPVAVLSNNDGVVVARSRELKALGVPMGEPYFRLKDLAPLYGIVFRSSNYELYGDISRRVMEVLREDSPILEQYSIDEAFIHINLKLHESEDVSKAYSEYAAHLREKLLKWIGMPVGIGFAQTKTLAKIANHTAKKLDSGLFVMQQPDYDLLREVPVGDVWGVGRRIADRLMSIGIRNAHALAEMEPHDVRRRFNVCLLRTVYELNGVNAIDYGEFDSPTKTATCSRAFGMPVTEFSDIRESIAEYTETAARRIREIGRKANGCSIYLQIYPEYHPVPLEGDFVSDNLPLKRPTSNTSEILAQILPRLPLIFVSGRRYKKSGVTLWGLDVRQEEQLELFTQPEKPPLPTKLYSTLDMINKRYGRATVQTLASGMEKNWKMQRNLLARHYTTRWDELATVN